MANELSMAEREAIAALLRQGWSKRRIARELNLHRDTVRRHARELASRWAQDDAAGTDSKQATSDKVATGTAGVKPASRVEVAIGDELVANAAIADVVPGARSSPAVTAQAEASAVGTPSRSRCEPYRKIIEEKIEAGLSAQRIYQDLCTEHGYGGAYNAVKRMVRRLSQTAELPFRRLECEPGAEAQADFGTGAPIVGPDGKRRRTHVLRLSLSFSRKGYSEACFRQSTENLLACWENAFWHWGGVPRTLVIDNLKAAVKQADWYDPELHPIIRSFCQHYGTVVLPTKPYTPRHKGKIEAGIKYVQDNGLKARRFATLAEENAKLLHWETQVADVRIHGTTKKQVRQLFENEKSTLLPLPTERFVFFHEAQRIVHRDGHIEVEKTYYSVPPEYMGHTVWARWDSHLVRILNGHFEQIALHARHESGKFRTDDRHLASRKIALIEQGATELLRRCRLIGPQAGRWAEAVLKERGIEGVRVLVGLLALVSRHSGSAVERACGQACAHGAFRLKVLRSLLKEPVTQNEFEFMANHPLIRNLHDYGALVPVEFN